MARSSKKSARKARQATRRAKYGGKTFFGRIIKAGTGIAGGLLTGNIGGALTSLLSSQKVDAEGNPTPAQLQENATRVQLATENSPVQQMKQEVREQQQPSRSESQQSEATEAPQTKEDKEKAAKAAKNKTFKLVAIGVGVVLLLVIVVKVLTPKQTA